MESLVTKPYKYQEIYDALYKLITNSKTGTKLASEREMAKTFDCNMLTIRKSLTLLAAQGLVDKRPRSGTFVAATKSSKGTTPSPNLMTILVHGDSDAYAYKLCDALTFEANSKGIDLKTIWYREFDKELLSKMKEASEDGYGVFIFPWIPYDEHSNHIKFIEKLKFPITTTSKHSSQLDRYFDIQGIAAMDVDNMIPAQIKYFLQAGFSKVGIIGPNNISNKTFNERVASYLSAMAEFNMETYIGSVDHSVNQVDNLVERWEKYAGKMAIICYDDFHALRILTSMHKRGLQAPNDFGVMGFNNLEQALYSDPPLTTIAEDFSCHARRMLQHAIENISDEIVFEPHPPLLKLMVRESCGAKEKLSDKLCNDLLDIGIEVCCEEKVINK